MKINQAGLDLIKKYEGFAAKKYYCPAGKPTIGFGHVIKSCEKIEDITYEQAERLLLQDLAIFENDVNKLIVSKINENQFSALVCFSYNLGCNALRESGLLRKVNQGEYLEVPAEFLRWCHVRGKKYKGLLRRRISEAQLFIS